MGFRTSWDNIKNHSLRGKRRRGTSPVNYNNKEEQGKICFRNWASKALFETQALARARVCFDNCACFAHALRVSDARTEPEVESKAEAMDSKRAYVNILPVL